MKKRFKKFMALVMAATLLCSSMTVFAANDITDPAAATGNTSGEAKLEGWVNKDVFRVQLPVVDLHSDAYKFVIDPQNLIGETSGEAYASITSNITGTGLYFTNYTSGNATGMSQSSDSQMAVNKGTCDVKVSLTASVSELSTVGLSSSKADLASADAKKTNIYLAIAASGDGVSGDAVETPITSAGGSVSFTLGKAADGAYKVTYTSGNASGNGYKYELTPELASANAAERAEFKKLSFNLVGACNTGDDVDWGNLKNVKPVVNVVWAITKVGGDTAPSIATTSYVYDASTTLPITVDLGSGSKAATGIASVSMCSTAANGTYNTWTSGSQYTYSNGTITILSGKMGSVSSGGTFYVKVVFDDDDNTTVVLTMTKR